MVDARNSRDKSGGEWQLRPGLTASVEFVCRSHEHAWKVPASALNFQPEPEILSDAARARLAQVPDASWRTVWVVGADDKPWPVFVRVGGVNQRSESAIQDAQSSEILEWDATLRPAPAPNDPTTYPHLVIAAPPVHKGGLFSAPRVKF
jgi:hypothetical protein